MKPKLALVGDAALQFTAAANLGAPETQFVSVYNAGLGTLTWQAGSSAGWIVISPTRSIGLGTLTVTVNPHGLAPGTYSGFVTITNAGLSVAGVAAAQAESVTIPVTLVVLPPKQQEIYLPLVHR